MQTRQMMAAMVAVSVVTFANADVSVYDVKFQPRTPWNGLVDISYSVACDDPNADIYINPTAYDGDRRITLFPKTLTGDGAESTVKPGKHVLTWDAKKDLGVFAAANFSVKIFAGRRLPRYVVVDLSSGADSANYPVRFSATGPNVSNDICRTTELWLRLVPPGEFWMGSPKDELGRNDDNEDLHHVTLTKPFYMGVFEVTQKQWELVRGDNPSYFCNAPNQDVRPVERMWYDDIRGHYDRYSPSSTKIDGQSFIGKVRAKAHFDGFDLPSEVRWEYACRAGADVALNSGKNIEGINGDPNTDEIAWYYANRDNGQSCAYDSVDVGTVKVGLKPSNALGLYDMHGNVREWCLDSYYWSHAGVSAISSWKNNHLGYLDVIDPVVPSNGYSESNNERMVRGGGWSSDAKDCRSAFRSSQRCSTAYDKSLGLRVCCEAGF